MRAGKLRHRITLLLPADPEKGVDAFGDVPAGYTPGPSGIPASVEPLTPSELFMASQVRADVTHKITMRWRGDVTAKMACQWNNGIRTRVFEFGPPLSTEERMIDLILTAVEKWP